MVLQEQARRTSEPLRWGRPQKVIVALLGILALLGVAAILAFALAGGGPARADCIDLSFPSTLGAAEVKGCGSEARRICLSGAYRGIAAEMQAACARAGFAYRRPPG